MGYNTEDLFYCEHLNATGPPGDVPVSSVDVAYAAWKSLTGVWPPTKPCEDNLLALDQVLQKVAPPLAGANCSVAFPALQQLLPNFDCDNSDTTPTIRDMCCSVCGGKPVQMYLPLQCRHRHQHRHCISVLCVIMCTIRWRMAAARPSKTCPTRGCVRIAGRPRLLSRSKRQGSGRICTSIGSSRLSIGHYRHGSHQLHMCMSV